MNATPGPVGRLIRLGLGAGVLYLLYFIAIVWRDPMWHGELPSDLRLLVLAGFAVYASSWVVRLLLDRPWGQRPLMVLLGGAALAAALGVARGAGFPSSSLTIYLWAWFGLFAGLLGAAFVLAALLGTPGCEMRAYFHLVRSFKGGDPDEVACPGGVDRFDHIGQRKPTTTPTEGTSR